MFRKTAFMLFVLMGLILTACTTPTAPASPTPRADIPNPASAYCEEHGGTVEIRPDAAGGQIGVCIFPDKSECDEWAYHRGDCRPGDSLQPATPAPGGSANMPNPASRYCEKNGGKVEFRQDAAGGVTASCVFPNQSECEEWAYYRDECQPSAARPQAKPTTFR
jgi:putative hemolysin